MNSPLLVLIVRLGPPAASEAYAQAIRGTFSDSNPTATAGGTSSTAAKELLETTELREYVFTDDPDLNPAPVLALADNSLDFLVSADRLLVIILDARSTAPVVPTHTLTPFEQTILVKLDRVLAIPEDAQRILNVQLEYPGALYNSSPTDPRITRLGLEDLDERDLHIPFLTLYALHNALTLFPNPAGKKPTLFFSHAKRDGVPLTTATLDWMTKRLHGFASFYDTKDLNVSGDIDKQLDTAIESAIVIVFRSDVFDQRYWCQKEVLWAEQHGRPVLTVDARWHIEHGPSVISFDNTPVVRIPDGSVTRIITAALLEALRVELFIARVKAHGASIANNSVRALPRMPSLVSLHGACDDLNKAASPSYVVYPNPSLPELLRQSVQGLAQTFVPGCEVRSLDEFRLAVK